MKNLLIVLMTLFCFSTYAQQNGNIKGQMSQQKPDFSPEQMAELATKNMTLRLDLNEAQQKKVHKLQLERAVSRKAQFKNKAERKQLSDTERFTIKTQRLDQQIAHKKQMKTILSQEQYQKWEEQHHKKRKGMKLHPKKHNRKG
jgi:hypothetical protein